MFWGIPIRNRVWLFVIVPVEENCEVGNSACNLGVDEGAHELAFFVLVLENFGCD